MKAAAPVLLAIGNDTIQVTLQPRDGFGHLDGLRELLESGARLHRGTGRCPDVVAVTAAVVSVAVEVNGRILTLRPVPK